MINKLIIAVLVFFVTGSVFAKKPKLLMVVPPDLYNDTEFSDSMLALDSAKVQVTIASTKTGTIKGVLGDSIKATVILTDVKIRKFDAICIMGGKGTGQYLWDSKQVKKLIIGFNDKKKLVTGICAGSVALAKAGVLQGVHATTYPVQGFIKKLEEGNAIYSSDSVVIDGRIITANGPVGARAFGRIVVDYLEKED